jgi:hypothetical protein
MVPDLRLRRPLASASQRYCAPRTTILPELWPTVAEAVGWCGLRVAAREFGISHETARQIVRRVAESNASVSGQQSIL